MPCNMKASWSVELVALLVWAVSCAALLMCSSGSLVVSFDSAVDRGLGL